MNYLKYMEYLNITTKQTRNLIFQFIFISSCVAFIEYSNINIYDKSYSYYGIAIPLFSLFEFFILIQKLMYQSLGPTNFKILAFKFDALYGFYYICDD